MQGSVASVCFLLQLSPIVHEVCSMVPYTRSAVSFLSCQDKKLITTLLGAYVDKKFTFRRNIDKKFIFL